MAGDTTNIPVTIYLSPALKRKLDKACETRGFTITGLARIAIAEHLQRLEALYDSEHRAIAR